MTPHRRRELALAALALLAGAVFFASLHRLWPLVRMDLDVPTGPLVRQARGFLVSRNFDVRGYREARRVVVDGPALDYAERAFGTAAVQRWIEEGLPFVHYRVDLKKTGEPTAYSVDLHPDRGVRGWAVAVEDDLPGESPGTEEARAVAREALRQALLLDPRAWEETSATTTRRPQRVDHAFRFERSVSRDPELRERVDVLVAGIEVVVADRSVAVPPAEERRVRASGASYLALETLGFLLAGVAATGAFVVFLTRLRAGTARFGRPATWVGILFACLVGTQLLQSAQILSRWEPLLPLWVFTLRYLVDFAIDGVWNLLLLLAVIAAGDALDQEAGSGRGDALWAASRGGLLERRVVLASGRGFLIGLMCGGVMAVAVRALEAWAGSHVSLQPRGFFFYAVNSASPTLSTLLFFLNVAMSEELAYRYFAGTWLDRITGRRWVAIAVPALIYGLTHTRLTFLPPADPFWGRALVMTLVGMVWGWAYFRYDALTVVLSHLTADLFIFNWPRLSSDRPEVALAGAATALVPLLPAILGAMAWVSARATRATARSRSPRGSPPPTP